MTTGFKTREVTKRAAKKNQGAKPYSYYSWQRAIMEITPLSPEKKAEFRIMVKERYGVEL